MNIQIDHVVIAGKDLDEMRVGFASVGLMPDEGGQHADGQTHNALIGFEDGSYLELIAPMPGGTAPGHVWSSYMNNDAGVCAWAIRSDDIRADVEMFRQRGITVGDPVQGGRNRPDGVRLEWITAKLGDGPLGSVLPFLIQDVTPRELRVPRTKSAEGLITGVAKILLKTDQYPETKMLFENAFALANMEKQLGDTWINQDYVHLVGTRITLRDSSLDYPEDEYRTWPGIYHILIGTPDWENAAPHYQLYLGGYQTKWFDNLVTWFTGNEWVCQQMALVEEPK